MHGEKAMLDEARAIAALAAAQDAAQVALCPPFPLIAAVATACPDMMIGGQDCHHALHGAFTGCVAAPMLVDAGAQMVIVGHSERRTLCHESNADVCAKAEAALSAGLRVILCVGESLDVRDAGDAVDFVVGQLKASLPDLSGGRSSMVDIAYEPIWAIGTGRTARPGDIVTMHAAIRAALGDEHAAMRILYGGSVNGDNAAVIIHLANVDGALVGGASLSAQKFAPIIAAATLPT